jgi:hypothetical protein
MKILGIKLTRRTLVMLGVAGLVAAGAAALIFKLALDQIERDKPIGATTFVPRTFRDVRESPGHQTHLEAEVTCVSCHSNQGGTFDRPAAAKCGSCHVEEATVHAAPIAAAATDCLSCHDFVGDRLIRPWGCLRCHGDPETTGAVAIELHTEVECATCHDAHATPSLHPPDCVSCHEREAAKHGPRGVEGAQRCLDCHAVHDTREAADNRCATCHRGRTGAPQIAAAATFGGHDKCVQCHQPHQFTRATAADCSSCHDEAIPTRKHDECATCHPPHDPRGAELRCAGCHTKVDPPPQGHSCLGCHPPHPEQAPPTPGAPGARLAAMTVTVECTSCHGGQQAHAGKLECASCHEPHRPAVAADVRACSRCHSAISTQTRRTAGSTVRGHSDCWSCHASASHQPSLPTPACGTCHTEEQASAPTGHTDCQSCHRPHGGEIRPDAACTSCHKPQRAGHGNKATCDTCHRPHGPEGPPSPPACVTCHEPGSLQGLHRAASHSRCDSCHTAHEARPRDDRATCTTAGCHKGLEDHEPKAIRCATCHPFTRGPAP